MIKALWLFKQNSFWVSCQARMSEQDEERLMQMVQMVQSAAQEGNLDQLKGELITPQDELRLVPVLLQKGDEAFFPIFTSLEEMGENGDSYTKAIIPFPDILKAAQANPQVTTLVINPFTQSFTIPRELFGPVCSLGEGKKTGSKKGVSKTPKKKRSPV